MLFFSTEHATITKIERKTQEEEEEEEEKTSLPIFLFF